MKKRKGGMEGLSTLVPKVYPSREPEEAQAQRLFAAWSRAVSPRVLKNARPVRFRNRALTVHTSTSAWANALSLESEELLAKLRNRVAHCRVAALRFRVGPLPPDVEPPPRRASSRPLRPLTDLPDEVARELAQIGDDDLRDTIARAASLSLSPDGRGAK